MTRSGPKSLLRKTLAASAALALTVPGMGTATAAPFAMDDAEAPPQPVAAPPSRPQWSHAPLLPVALALAASEARREAADSAAELRTGADGRIDLSLSTVIDLTLRHNLDLLVQSYSPALSEEQLKARQALYDPLLTFLVSLASSSNPSTSAFSGAEVVSNDAARWDVSVSEQLPWGGQASFGFNNSRDKTNSAFASPNPAYNSSFAFNITQPLLRNFGRSNTEREIRIARNDRRAAEVGYRDQVQSKVTEAIGAYWDLVGAIENLQVQREALRIGESLLKINRTRVEVGTMAPLDISLAEAEVKINEKSVIEAEELVRLREDRIRQLINLPLTSALWTARLNPVDPPVLEERAIDIDGAITTALARRGEIRRQELALANADIRVSYAKNQLLPALNLRAGYGATGLGGTEVIREDGPFGDGPTTLIPGGYGDALDQLTGFSFDNWTLAATLDLPVFNRAARANHAASALERSAERDRLDLARQTVALEVRRLGRAVETNSRRIAAARSTHKLQEERLNAESKKFEHGLSTNFEVQQAQKDLTTARVGEVVARTDYLKALADLERAMGTVLETHGVRIQE